MHDLSERAAALRAAYDDCFGCGLNNPLGLHLDDFAIDDNELVAAFTPRPEFRGFAGVLHGGILASVLDETLAWTAMMLADTFVVTASLEIKYRKPAPTGDRYELRGRIEEQRGRRLRLSGTASVADVTIAEATGLFLATEAIPDTAST